MAAVVEFAAVAEFAAARAAFYAALEQQPVVDIISATNVFVGLGAQARQHIGNAVAFASTMVVAEPGRAETIDEVAAIHVYTMTWDTKKTSPFFVINRALRSGRDVHLYLPYARLLVSGLLKQPETEIAVWRGVNEMVEPGAHVMDPAFTSCSDMISCLASPLFLDIKRARTLYSLQVRTGRRVAKFSRFPDESEILLLPYTSFRVVGALQQGALQVVQATEETSPDRLDVAPPLAAAVSLASGEPGGVSKEVPAGERPRAAGRRRRKGRPRRGAPAISAPAGGCSDGRAPAAGPEALQESSRAPVQGDRPDEKAPAEALAEAPAKAPLQGDSPDEKAPTDAPAEAPTDAPAEAPTEAPAEAPTEAPPESSEVRAAPRICPPAAVPRVAICHDAADPRAVQAAYGCYLVLQASGVRCRLGGFTPGIRVGIAVFTPGLCDDPVLSREVRRLAREIGRLAKRGGLVSIMVESQDVAGLADPSDRDLIRKLNALSLPWDEDAKKSTLASVQYATLKILDSVRSPNPKFLADAALAELALIKIRPSPDELKYAAERLELRWREQDAAAGMTYLDRKIAWLILRCLHQRVRAHFGHAEMTPDAAQASPVGAFDSLVAYVGGLRPDAFRPDQWTPRDQRRWAYWATSEPRTLARFATAVMVVDDRLRPGARGDESLRRTWRAQCVECGGNAAEFPS